MIAGNDFYHATRLTMNAKDCKRYTCKSKSHQFSRMEEEDEEEEEEEEAADEEETNR